MNDVQVMHDYSSSSGSGDEAPRRVTVQPQRAHSAENLQVPTRVSEQQVPPLPHYDELRHMSPPPGYTHDDPSAHLHSLKETPHFTSDTQ